MGRDLCHKIYFNLESLGQLNSSNIESKNSTNQEVKPVIESYKPKDSKRSVENDDNLESIYIKKNITIIYEFIKIKNNEYSFKI